MAAPIMAVESRLGERNTKKTKTRTEKVRAEWIRVRE
jgi:hypothetical protein